MNMRSGFLGTAESNASGMPNWEAVSGHIKAARAALTKARGPKARATPTPA